MAIACQRSDCIHNRGYCRRAEVGVEIDGNGRCSNYEAEGVHDGSKFDGDFYYCRCKACNAKVGDYVSESEARAAWNHRVQSADTGKSSDQVVDANKMMPLTLDELREMEGKPVWVTFEPEEDGTPIAPCWMLVNVEEKRLVTEYEWVDWNDEGYKAYRTKPNGGGNDAERPAN